MAIGKHAREFKARVHMCNELNSNIRHNVELQRVVCYEQTLHYINIITDASTLGKAKWKKTKQRAREQYLTMLYFDGLNRNAYLELHNEIHKAYQIGGVNALPKRYDRTIFLTGKHKREKG